MLYYLLACFTADVSVEVTTFQHARFVAASRPRRMLTYADVYADASVEVKTLQHARQLAIQMEDEWKTEIVRLEAEWNSEIASLLALLEQKYICLLTCLTAG